MILPYVLKKIKEEHGINRLFDSSIVNIISDYDSRAFEPQSLKTILKSICSEGILRDLVINQNEVLSTKLKDNFIAKQGCQESQLDYVINSFKYAIGELKVVPKLNINQSYDNSRNENIVHCDSKNSKIKDTKRIQPTSTFENSSYSAYVTRDTEHKTFSDNNKLSSSKKYSKKKLTKKYPPSKGSGCGCLIIGFLILGILGAIFDNKDNAPQKDPNTPDTIMLSREEMDTLKWEDGTPKEMKSIEKKDIKLILSEDSLYLITPYETAPLLSIKFKYDSIYNKESKKMEVEHVYNLPYVRKQGEAYVYGKAKKVLPVVEQNQINNRIDGFKIKYYPKGADKYRSGYNYEYSIGIFSSEVECKIKDYFSVYR